MPDSLTITVDGRPVQVPTGATLAAAILLSGQCAFRRSEKGEPRGPLCGIGICFECRVTLDGVPHIRSCQILCRDGMQVQTNG
jgi:sarcosine oxidase subunit alpha